MSEDSMIATRTVTAPIDAVFGVLADPASHAAIDGTGWVREPLDPAPITATGQVFRIQMFHPNHPNGEYVMSNLVEVLDAPRAIAWRPGQPDDDGVLRFGGWTWRYDLAPAEGGTEVTLTYDWSEVSEEVRERIGFPPFPVEHLTRSLDRLAALATCDSRLERDTWHRVVDLELDLPADVADALRRIAAREGISEEQTALRAVVEHLAAHRTETTPRST